jgi:hypothetical protein
VLIVSGTAVRDMWRWKRSEITIGTIGWVEVVEIPQSDLEATIIHANPLST